MFSKNVKEKISKKAVPTTAATIWLPESEDPSNPIDNAAAP